MEMKSQTGREELRDLKTVGFVIVYWSGFGSFPGKEKREKKRGSIIWERPGKPEVLWNASWRKGLSPFFHWPICTLIRILCKGTLPEAGNNISKMFVIKFIYGFFSHLIFLKVCSYLFVTLTKSYFDFRRLQKDSLCLLAQFLAFFFGLLHSLGQNYNNL